MSHSSQRPSEPAYYIEDCRISCFLLLVREHCGKFLSEIVFKLPQYWVLNQHDFEIMIWIILNARQILFLENANHTKFIPNIIFCLDFWSIIDKRDQSGASACVADLDFVIEYFFLLSSVSKLEVLSSGACRQTR